MIYKITLSVSGDHFWPETVMDRFDGDFIVMSHHSPTDIKFKTRDGTYGYGGILFWHPKEFAVDERVVEYEKAFVDFIERNYSLFIENKAEDFEMYIEMYIEIYYDGGQCNFEIFNKEILRKLANFGVSIPVSVYQLEENKFNEWQSEIEAKWSETDPTR